MTTVLRLFTVLALVTSLGVTVGVAHAAPSDQCKTSSESRQPVLLVHGFNSGPQTWGADARAQLAGAGTLTCIDVFDYSDIPGFSGDFSTHWVTRPEIAHRLALRIVELGDASKRGGGSGKIVVVAHSMGGLATRCATAASCNGDANGAGVNGVTDRIAELITFGTPSEGSWLSGPTLHDVARTAGWLISASCSIRLQRDSFYCPQVRALGTSDAGRAFKPNSDELNAIAEIPVKFPVYTLAARIELQSSFFGNNLAELGDGGDLVVLRDSALAAAQKVGDLGGTQIIDCGALDITTPARARPSCWHGSETNDTRFLQAAAHQIALVQKGGGGGPPTSRELANATLPAGTCTGSDIGWPQPVPITLRNGTGVARNPDESFAGASVIDAKAVGSADVDGDGQADGVLQFTCIGSTPEECCAGRTSNATFVVVLGRDPAGGLRMIGPVIRAGLSTPGDQYGPALRDVRSTAVDSSTVTTTEYIYYPEQYSADQVGGDARAPVTVRHEYRDGRWATSRRTG